MPEFLDWLQTDSVLAFLLALAIFLFTILLIVKEWVNFSMAFLLLLFSLTVGLAITHQRSIRCYLEGCYERRPVSDQQVVFADQIKLAIEDLKKELENEKENIQHIVYQVQEVFDQVDYQRQKLQAFIEKTQDHFKQDAKTEGSPGTTEEASPLSVES